MTAKCLRCGAGNEWIQGKATITEAERIATLEARVKELETSLNRHKDNVCKGRMEELEGELSALKSNQDVINLSEDAAEKHKEATRYDHDLGDV